MSIEDKVIAAARSLVSVQRQIIQVQANRGRRASANGRDEGKDLSREEAVAMLRAIAKAGGNEGKAAEKVLTDNGESVQNDEEQDALRAKMGLRTKASRAPRLEGRSQVIPTMTPTEAREIAARKGVR